MFNNYLDPSILRNLPNTSGRYVVSGTDFTVFDLLSNNYTEVTRGVLGPEVILDWYDGLRAYPVKEIIAHSFIPTEVPVRYWNLMKVEVIDGCEENLNPSNLLWVFPPSMACEELNGYTYIPFFSRYVINREGLIFDFKSKRFVKGRYIKGYFSFVLIADNDIRRRNLFRHKALGLSFLNYDASVVNKQINHKDGVKGHDSIDNLEWCSGSHNRKHAIENYLTQVNKPVIVENNITGEIKELCSIAEASRLLGVSDGIISRAIKSKSGKFCHGFFCVWLKNREDAFRSIGDGTEVVARNLITKETLVFKSISSCARHIGITKHNVLTRIENGIDKIYPDFWQIKRKRDNLSWKPVHNPELELLKQSWSKVVLVKDLETSNVLEFQTQRETGNFLGLSEVSVRNRLVSGKQTLVKSALNGKFFLIQRKMDFRDWRVIKDPLLEYQKDSSERPVIVTNVLTGKETEFSSLTECAKVFGLQTNTLCFRLKHGHRKIYPPGLSFRYKIS